MRVRIPVRAVIRRLAEAPLHLIGQELRAEIVERESEALIVTVPIPGMSLRFYAPTPLLQVRAMGVLNKEPDMISWIDDFSEDAVFWDIGANVGVFSLYAAARTGCRVQAFEPAAANFHVLVRNITLNNLADHITAFCAALSGKTELGVLNSSSLAMGAALSQFGRPGDRSRYMNGTSAGRQGMLGFTVDSFIELFHPPFPTYIKLDVDGLELAIVEGAHKTLRDPRLRSVMIELSLSDVKERMTGMAMMVEAGFRYVSHGEPQVVDTESAANHLFVRELAS
jgi:FkbM family methyltransferase